MRIILSVFVLLASVCLAQDATLQRLIQPLNDPDGAVRADACDELGALYEKARGSVDALLTVAESDEDPNVRKAALGALAKIGLANDAQIERVVSLLGQSESDQAQGILVHLGKRAIKPLTAALAHDSQGVRNRVARTLAGLWETSTTTETVEFATPDLTLRLPPETILALGSLLDDPETAETALFALSRLTHGEGAPLVDKLILFVADDTLQEYAIRALGRTRSKAALPVLQGLLENSEGEVACEAAVALAEFGSAARSATSVLVTALLNGDRDLRAQSAEALGAIGGPRAWAALVKALENAPEKQPKGRLSFGTLETWQAAEFALKRCGADATESVRLSLPKASAGQRLALQRILAAWEKDPKRNDAK